MQAHIVTALLCLCIIRVSLAQNVGINDNGATPNPYAILDVDATNNNKGILIPRLSTAQRIGISGLTGSEQGLMVYDETTTSFWFWTGAQWSEISTQGVKLMDSDQDTEVKVEESPDEDVIRFYIAGQQKMTLQRNASDEARLDLMNTSGSVFAGEACGTNNQQTGLNNTGIGSYTLFSNTTGQNNSALGSSALSFNTTGSFNTAIGAESLLQNTTATRNTAIGYRALRSTTTGVRNIGIGSSALHTNTTGVNNVAIGSDALSANQTGNWNVAIGDNALKNDQDVYATVAIGSNALANNSGGTQNTALGFSALFNNTTGSENTGLGNTALIENTAGTQNTGIGSSALHDNVSGNHNTAIGARALSNNTLGHDNTAVGRYALEANNAGFGNTSVGMNSMEHNTSGSNNTTVGKGALSGNTISSYNTAIGANAMYTTYEGFGGNTAIGSDALYGNIDGRDNVAIGSLSGSTPQHSNHSTFLGTGANSLVSTTNSTALGCGALITEDNQVRIGNSNVTSIGGQVGWTNLSDGRFKTDIHDDVPGLAFILKLRPVTYHIDDEALNAFFQITDAVAQRNTKSAHTLHTGFIAQEVESAAYGIGYEFSGVDRPQSDHSAYGLRYAEFVTPLVKAVQEQQEMITALREEIVDLRQTLSEISTSR